MMSDMNGYYLATAQAVPRTAPRLSGVRATAPPPPPPSLPPPASKNICRDYIWGICTLNDNCRYRHVLDLAAMKATLRFCHDYQNRGGCVRPQCTYLHTSIEEQNLFLDYDVIPRVLRERYAALDSQAPGENGRNTEMLIKSEYMVQPSPLSSESAGDTSPGQAAPMSIQPMVHTTNQPLPQITGLNAMPASTQNSYGHLPAGLEVAVPGSMMQSAVQAPMSSVFPPPPPPPPKEPRTINQTQPPMGGINVMPASGSQYSYCQLPAALNVPPPTMMSIYPPPPTPTTAIPQTTGSMYTESWSAGPPMQKRAVYPVPPPPPSQQTPLYVFNVPPPPVPLSSAFTVVTPSRPNKRPAPTPAQAGPSRLAKPNDGNDYNRKFLRMEQLYLQESKQDEEHKRRWLLYLQKYGDYDQNNEGLTSEPDPDNSQVAADGMETSALQPLTAAVPASIPRMPIQPAAIRRTPVSPESPLPTLATAITHMAGSVGTAGAPMTTMHLQPTPLVLTPPRNSEPNLSELYLIEKENLLQQLEESRRDLFNTRKKLRMLKYRLNPDVVQVIDEFFDET